MLAEDLVQDTINTGITNCDQLRDESRLFAWVCTILKNKWYSHIRKTRNHDELNENIPSEEYGPCMVYQKTELVEHIRSVVAALPLDQRQVITLVDLEELSYHDVADVLEIPVGTVMSRLHRARKFLLDKLDNKTGHKHMSDGQLYLVE